MTRAFLLWKLCGSNFLRNKTAAWRSHLLCYFLSHMRNRIKAKLWCSLYYKILYLKIFFFPPPLSYWWEIIVSRCRFLWVVPVVSLQVWHLLVSQYWADNSAKLCVLFSFCWIHTSLPSSPQNKETCHLLCLPIKLFPTMQGLISPKLARILLQSWGRKFVVWLPWDLWSAEYSVTCWNISPGSASVGSYSILYSSFVFLATLSVILAAEREGRTVAPPGSYYIAFFPVNWLLFLASCVFFGLLVLRKGSGKNVIVS